MTTVQSTDRLRLPARLALALALAAPTTATAAPARPTDPAAPPRSSSTTTPGATATPPRDAPPTTARSAPTRVVVLPRQEGDALPASVDASLRESLRDGLRLGGAAPVQPNSVDLASCDAACLGRLRASFGVRYAVRATLAVVDRDYTLRLELLDTTGAVVSVFDERCALCGLTEARARLADGAARLLTAQTAPPPAPPTATLSITADPVDAELDLDGAPIGRAPLSPTVNPGAHTLRAHAPGHATATQALGVREGQTLAVHLHLVPEPRAPRLRPPILLGLGVPVLTAGLVLVALDGRDRRGCEDCRPLETTWPGAALVLAGTALTSVGAVLLHQALARRRAARR